MAEHETKRRYIKISGNGLPSCYVAPRDVSDMVPEFVGDGAEPMDEPVVLTEVFLTDAEYEALGDWSP